MSAGRVNDVHPPAVESQSKLNIPKHIQYWKRCLKTYLPTAYQSNDANRMMLSYFIISAMDLLDCLDSSITKDERGRYIDWIYHCQHSDGGFRGFPGGDLGALRNEENSVWDPANIPATYFALAILAILKDDFKRVKRIECLQWLTKMQRADGNFGETMGVDGKIEGGMDPRFSYTAMGIRAILRGKGGGEVVEVPDIDLDKLVECIRRTQCYDGGISESPYHEPHGGYTYCALSALSFVQRLAGNATVTPTSINDPELTLHWLLGRQTTTFDEDDNEDTLADETDTIATGHDAFSFVDLTSNESANGPDSSTMRPTSNFELQWIGFNGRCNKIADTCYSWWIVGSLAILGKLHLSSLLSNRRYLLDKTQHLIGGFGKKEGAPPDIYHAYLGLAALSLMDEPNLKAIDATACFSLDAWKHVEGLPWNGGKKEEVEELRETSKMEASYVAMSGG